MVMFCRSMGTEVCLTCTQCFHCCIVRAEAGDAVVPKGGWYPLVLNLLVDHLILLPQHNDLLPGPQGELHPDLGTLFLAVWRLRRSLSKQQHPVPPTRIKRHRILSKLWCYVLQHWILQLRRIKNQPYLSRILSRSMLVKPRIKRWSQNCCFRPRSAWSLLMEPGTGISGTITQTIWTAIREDVCAICTLYNASGGPFLADVKGLMLISFTQLLFKS